MKGGVGVAVVAGWEMAVVGENMVVCGRNEVPAGWKMAIVGEKMLAGGRRKW